MDDVLEIGGDGFVDEDGFAEGHDFLGLIEVGATVQAEDHDGIDFGTEGGNAIDHADAVFVFEDGGEFGEPGDAFGEIGAACWEGSDHAAAGDVVGIGGIVQAHGELFSMRGVESNQADSEWVSHKVGSGEQQGGESTKLEKHGEGQIAEDHHACNFSGRTDKASVAG